MKNITSSFLKSALFALLFFSSLNVALADGSKDMYPADYDGTYRARLFATRYGNGDGTYNFPFVTYGTMKVYAKEGEHIYLAASNMKSDAKGRIDWRSPDGKSGSFSSNSSSQGYIANRTKELAGPNLQNNSTGDGYNAFVLTVGAGQEGVWEIDFRSTTDYSETYKTNEASCKVESWDDGTSYWLISAFDASVSNVADDEFIHGRVYTNVLNLNMADGAKDWKPTFYVLTNTGYLYEVNPNGLAGHNFTFFANNKGVQTNVHGTLDKSNYGYPAGFAGQYGGVPAYGSVDPNKESPYPVYDPRLPDRVTKRMIDGVEVDCSDITHKIFFCKPAADMPESVEHCVYGTTIQPTWLVSKENAKDAPILSNLCIAGKESHLPGVMGPEGVEVYFEANSAGEYVIELDFKDSRYENITFSGTCEEGVNTIDWDGKDNKGVLVEDATVSLSGQLKSAEIHFPFIDIESNVYGFYLKQFNAEWTAISRDVMYWDDSNVTSTKDAGDDDIKKLAGQASPGHKFVDRGDNIILDTWTYASGVSAGAQNQVVHANYIDLKVNSITCDKTVAHIGDEITYTIEVQNVNGTNVLLHSAGVYVDTKANADSASVGVWFPNGGFNTTSVTLVSSTDDDCSVIQQPSGEEYGLGFITLKNGHSATVEVKGYANSKLAHSVVSPVGFIMRPGDYYEVDANNINDDGMPLVPQKTTSGSEKGEYDTEWENNNLTTSNPTIFFLNSAPEAENDVLKVAKGEVTTGTIAVGPLANDTDVDADDLIITEVYYMDGATKKTITLGSSHTIKVGGTTYGTITIYADGRYSANISAENSPILQYVISDQFAGVSSSVIPDYEEKYKDLDLIPGIDNANITLQIDHKPSVSSTNMSICLSASAKKINGGTDESQVLPIVVEDIDGDAITSVTFAQSGSTNYAGNFSYSNGEIMFTAKKNCTTKSGSGGSATYSYNTITVKVTVVTATLSSEQVITLTLENGTPTEVTGFAVSGSTVEYGTTVADAVSVTLPSVSGSYSIKEGTASVYDETILPVGTHTLSYMYVPSGETCYTPSTKTAIVKVTPKTITPSATGVDKEYDGTTTATVTSVTGSGILTGDNVTVTATSAVFANANVGTNKTVTVTYSLSGTDASNYVLSSTTGTTTADITAKDVTITVDDKEKVYGATTPTFTGSVSGLINDGDLGTISYSRISTNENAGTYTDDLTASFTANTNYNVSVTKGTFTIKPITDEITVTITGNSDATKVYTGSEQSVTGFDYDNKDKCTVALKTGEKAEAKGTNAGTYTMGLTESMFDVTSTNYSNIKVVIVDGSMTISPATITVTSVTAEDKEYDATTDAEISSVVFSGVQNSEATSVINVTATGSFENANVGTDKTVAIASYTLTGTGKDNYQLATGAPESTTADITAKEVVLDWGTTSFKYDGTEKTVTATVTNAVNSDVVTVTTYTGNKQTVAGSDYVAEATALDNTNYVLPSNATTSWEITKNDTELTVTITGNSDLTKVYTGSEQSVTGFDYDNKDKCTVALKSGKKAEAKGTNAGDYTMGLTESMFDVTSTNYSNIKVVVEDGSMTINPATITVTTPTVKDKDYDATKTAEINGNLSFSGVQNSEGTSVINVTAVAEFEDANVGTDKDVTVSYTLEGTGKDNYVLASETATTAADIAALTIIPSATGENKTYDGTTTATVTSVSGSGILTGDDVTVTATSANFGDANVGTGKTVTVVYSLSGTAAGNYVLGTPTATTANITALTIIPSATGVDKEYDGTTTATVTSVTGSGIVDGDNVIVSASSATFANADAGTDKAVTVIYSLSGTDAGNYVLGTPTATTADITAKEVGLTWSTPASFEYDATSHSVTATVTGLVSPDVCTVTSYTNNEKTEVGEYTASATALSNANYTLPSSATYAWEITTQTAETDDQDVTLSEGGSEVDDETYTYDGTEKKPTVVVKDKDGNVIPETEYTVTYDDNTEAGTGKVIIKDKEGGNYVVEDNEIEFKINPKDVGLTWSTPASFEYDAASHSVTATVTGLVSPDVCTVTSYTNNEKTEVGEYTASATALSNANYTLPSSATYAWEITTQTAETDDQDVTLSEGGSEVDDETYTYDGTEKKPTVVVKDKDGNVIPETEYTVTYDDNTEAGTGKVIIKDKEGGNYVVEDNEIEFKINPKEVGLTWSTPASFEYDAASHSVTATVTGLVSPDVCTVTSYTNNEKTEVGEYTASATALSNANYTLPSSATYAWEITTQTAETDDQDVTLSEGGSEVDDETYTYDGTEKKPTVVVKDKDGNVIPETEYTVTYDDNTEAGTGKVIIKDKEGGNYVVEDNEIEFKINPKEVGLTWSTPASFEYDAASHSVTATVTGLVSPDVCTVTSYTNNEKTEVGEYTASATALSNANYTLPSSATYAWEITVQTAETDDQDVTLTEGGSEVDDETYTYDGTEKKPTVVVKDKDGNVIPETEYTVTYDDNTEAGTGKVIIKDKEGGNYVVEDNEIEFKINPKEVGLTWSTPESFEYDAASHSVTAMVTGLVSPDVCTVTSYTNNEKTEVGEYTASATALSNANYTLPSSATYAWEITTQTAETDDQDVTLSEGGSEVDDETYTYDGTEKKPTVVVKDKDGNVIPDTEYTVTYDDNTEAGTGKVIIKDKEGGNYVVEDNEIEFVINKAPITVTTPIVSDKTYDGSTTGAIDGDIEFTGVQNSEGTSVINVTAVAEFDDATAGTAKDVTVTYTLEGTGASNYVLVSASDVTSADIDPKEVTINWGTTTFEYDGESKEVTASISGVVDGDNCTISLAGNVETEVGSYTAVPSLTGDDAANYVLPADPNKSWTISMDVLHKEEQTITLTEAGSEVTDETYTYDGTPKTPTVVVTDDKGNIVPDTEYTVTYEENTDAGTATVTITNKEGGNYTVEENSVTYKINPAVITVTEASVTEKTYDGTDEAEVTVSAFTGKVGSDDVTVTATGTFEDANAGTDKDVTVEYTLSGDGASNYVLIVDTDTKQGTIGQKEVTLDWSDVLEFEYDGESHGVTVEVTGLVGDDECDATVTNNTGVDAQSYTAEVTALSNDNYKLPAVTTQDWEITPQDLDATNFTVSGGSDEATYDGTPKPIVFTSEPELTEGTDYEVYYKVDDTWTTDAPTNAGEYEVKIDIINPDYKDEDIEGFTLTINPAVITVDGLSATDKEYDGTKTADASITSFTGVQNSEGTSVINVVVTKAEFKDANAGEDRIVDVTYALEGTGASNYVLVNTTSETTATITPKEVTLDWGTTTFEYNGSDQTVTATVTNAVGSDVVTVTTYTDNKQADAGDYTAEATGLSNTNYVLPADATQAWSITKKDVDADDYEISISPTNTEYDGTEKKPGITITIGDKTIPASEYIIEYEDNVDAGTATVTIKNAEGGNYTLDTKSGNFTITPRAITLKSASEVFSYDAAEHKKEVVEISSGSLAGTDKFAYSDFTVVKALTTGTDNEFTVTATSGKLTNYDITYIYGKLIVNAVELNADVELSQYEFVYDATAKEPTVTVYDPNGNVIPSSEYSVVYEDNINAGTATATVKIVPSAETGYVFSDITETFEIKQREVALVWSTPTEFTYDGTLKSVTASVDPTSLVSTDECTVTVTDNEATAVNSYTAKAISLSNNNYTLPENNTQDWKINSKVVSTEDQQVELSENGSVIDDNTYTYGGDEKKPTVVVKDENGDVVPPEEYTVTYEENTDAGTAKVIITDKEGGNYTVETNEIPFVINQKEVVLDWSDDTDFEYNGETHGISVEVKGLVGDDECEPTVTGNQGTDAGNYTAEVTALSNDNYKLPSTPTQDWTITPMDLSEANFTVKDNTDSTTYNGKPQDIVFTTEPELTEGDDYVVYYKVDDTWTTEAPTNAGEYEVKIDIINPNYNDEDITGFTLVIEPKEVTLSLDDNLFQYDAAEHSVNVLVGGIEEGDVCNPTVTGTTSATNVDKYDVTVTGLDNANYKLPEDVTLSWKIADDIIAKDDQQVTLFDENDDEVDNTTYTYGNDEKKPTVVVKDKNGNVIPATEYTVTYEDNVDAGTAKVIIKDVDGGNFTIEDNEIEFTINKKEITPKMNTDEFVKTYDGTTVVTTVLDVELVGLIEGDDAGFSVEATYNDVNASDALAVVAEYSITNSNYVLANTTETVSTTGSIKPIQLIATSNVTTTKTYDGTTTAEVTLQDVYTILAGDDVVVTPTANYEDAEAGEFKTITITYTISGADAGNYIAPVSSTVSGSIEKTVHDKDEYSVIKPADLVYDGNEKEVTVAGPGDITVLYSEDGTTWTEEKPVDAGTYQVKIVVDETESTEAISISDPEWTFTIEKADQDAPEVTATGTSAPGEKDGKIDGLENTMEISTDGGTTWVKVDYPEIADIIEWIISGEEPDVMVADCNLPAGEYQVRYAEDANHNASPATIVIIEEGNEYIDMVDEDSFEVVADGYCPETDGEVHFEIIEGNPTEFRAVILNVDSVSIADATYKALDEDDMFMVYIPNCDAGSYTIQVQFRNDAGAESPVYTFPIQVNLTKKYITNIWDDVVSIINKADLNEPENLTKRFNAYQWYRDGEMIPGANLPYYNEEGGLYGEYYVEVTTIDGKELRTCSQEWHLVYGEVSMIVYPNPVVTTATVELSGDDMMTEHQLLITNVAGNMTFLKTTFMGKTTQIDMSAIPVGEYVVVVDGISTKVIKK